jgi:pimeloyl-ACP methyl ester carboxylesterase
VQSVDQYRESAESCLFEGVFRVPMKSANLCNLWIKGVPRWACLVALLVLGSAACATAAADHRVYSQPKYGIDRFVQVHGYTIHYVEVGSGRPVVLIPGAFTTYRAWNRVLPALSLHNRVLAVDYLGAGDSDKPETGFRYTVEEQADLLADMIAELRLTQVAVVGASYGGAVALNLASRYPDLVDHVVCIEGGALILPDVLRYNKLGALLEWPILGDIIWGFMQSGLFDGVSARSIMADAWETLTPEEQDEIVEIVTANIRTMSKSSWIGVYRAITERIDFMDAMAGLRARVMYVFGTESKYRAVADMNVERFKAQSPNLEIVPFEGGIHDLHLQYPTAVARIVLRFLGTPPEQDVVAGPLSAPATGDRAAQEIVR